MCATLREPCRATRSEGDVTSLRPIGVQETIMASSFNLNAYGAMFRVRAAYSFEVAVSCAYVRVHAHHRYRVHAHAFGVFLFHGGLGCVGGGVRLFLISPRVSKKIDERGQGAIVVPATCIALSGCAILLVTVLLKLPIALCFVGAVLMGFLPTPQALTRARWVYLVKSGRLGDGAPELKTVFSYEGVMDDIVFMVSPAISIALASGIHPIAGMGCGFICCVVGTLLLASSKDTEPVPGWEKKLANREGAALADCSEGAASAESGAAAEGSGRRMRSRSWLGHRVRCSRGCGRRCSREQEEAIPQLVPHESRGAHVVLPVASDGLLLRHLRHRPRCPSRRSSLTTRCSQASSSPSSRSCRPLSGSCSA